MPWAKNASAGFAMCGHDNAGDIEKKHFREIEVMLDYENARVVTLGDLTPDWWI